jgi:hypothetical protein
LNYVCIINLYYILYIRCAIPIIDDAIEGYNGCIFAYGQTGAGKTYTMSGPSVETHHERGLCKRTADYLFEKARIISNNREGSISLKLSALEIYNESVIDLLRDSSASLNGISDNKSSTHSIVPAAVPKLTIIDTPSGVMLPALFLLPMASTEDAYSFLLESYSNRAVGEHMLNRRSSRSHVLYTFYITRTKGSGEDQAKSDILESKLHLVDLAGSERVKNSGAEGTSQKEASHINKSLSFLEQVVVALTQSKREHIPYRQSKLTYLLKDSLGGNCNTYMIACVWPHQKHSWESLSTLRFAARMKCVENIPIRNSLVSKNELPSSRLLNQIESLKKELIMRDTIIGSDAWLPKLTNSQKINTMKMTCNLVENQPNKNDPFSILSSENNTLDNAFEVKSLSQVNLVIGTLHALLWDACDNDKNKIMEVMNKTTNGMLPLRNDINKIEKKIEDFHISDKIIDRDNEINKSNIDSPKDYNIASPKDNNMSSQKDNNIESPKDNNNEQQGINNNMSFEEFKQSPKGLPLHQSYLDAKTALKMTKVRQKGFFFKFIIYLNLYLLLLLIYIYIDIIEMVRTQKVEIERLNQELSMLDGKEDDNNNDIIKEKNEINILLKEAATNYKIAMQEMKLCKQELTETESLKKRVISTLVRSFELYQQN